MITKLVLITLSLFPFRNKMENVTTKIKIDGRMNVTTITDINHALESDPFSILLLILAICCNLLLLSGIVYKISLNFIPWMIFYGLELFASWISGFFLLFGTYPI